MPFLRLQTNQTLNEEEKAALCKLMSECIAERLGKSEDYVMVSVDADSTMTFAATDRPCAFLELKSIGLSTDNTGDLSKHICQMIQQNLGVGPDRIYIEFSDVDRALWGWNGKTF